MKRAGSAPPGGRSGANAAAGLRHEDGTPFSAVELERAAAQYRRHTPEGHVLERPDMYVGSTERITAAVPVHDGEAYRPRRSG